MHILNFHYFTVHGNQCIVIVIYCADRDKLHFVLGWAVVGNKLGDRDLKTGSK